jgi:Fe-S-cluster formation regulator IscX/YfhJ
MPDIHFISEPLRQFAVPLDALRKDPRNARLHPDRNLQAIRQSLRKFGQQKPIVLSDDGLTIIAGNGTLEAAALEGWSHIAAITSALAGRDATAYGLADNRTAETAEWDFERVSALVTELRAYDYELDALGWASYELDTLCNAAWSPPAVDEAAATGVAGHGADAGCYTDSAKASEGTERAPSGGKPDLKYVPFTDDQHEIVTLAVGKLREKEDDPDISEGRAIELILADWLAGQ